MRSRFWVLAIAAGAAILSISAEQPAASNILRATLDNGLRVVVVRDPFAPVVTVEENYLAEADETPPGFPGLAHAQEHMAFRGCAGLSSDQIAAAYAQMGGSNNADTQQDVTQYFATVPAENLSVALRLDAACMQQMVDSDEQWEQERGAIEQEVARDLSNPTYKFVTRLNQDLFAGTPYAHDALGTKGSFDATTREMLRKFFQDWYAPNNAILVICGNVDADKTLASVKQIYGAIPRRDVPKRPEVKLAPVKAESFTIQSDLPYKLVFLAWRMPGTDSPDSAAARIMAETLASQRASLYNLVVSGKALATDFANAETYRKASVAFAAAAIPANGDAVAAADSLRKIVAGYAARGLPADLVDAAKRSALAAAEFRRNSIPGLAESWSEAVAAEGKRSPDEDVAAIAEVTLADVNRLARTYLTEGSTITATLDPAPSGTPVEAKGFGGAEQVTSPPAKPVTLPDWAASALETLAVPQSSIHPVEVTLANGIRLIVQTETISPDHHAGWPHPPGAGPRNTSWQGGRLRYPRRPVLVRHQRPWPCGVSESARRCCRR
jgi:zinc protease